MATTLTSVVWVIVVGALVAIAATVLVLKRRSSAGDGAAAPPAASAPARPPRPAETPMTGLQSALAQVTDRDGRPIGERIDAESQHVDDLRIPDDTGPLLRRALDHVEHPHVEHQHVEQRDAEQHDPRSGDGAVGPT